jgi:tetratricopeptide (TPR) repeat protein
VNDALAGRSAQCRQCGTTMTVPQTTESEPPAPEGGISFQDEVPARRATQRPPQQPPPDEQEYAVKDEYDQQEQEGDYESSEQEYSGSEGEGEGGEMELGAEPESDVGAVFNEFALRNDAPEEKQTRRERMWPLIPDIASEVILPPLLMLVGIGVATFVSVQAILHSSNRLLGFILLVASLLLYFFGVVPIAIKAVEGTARSLGFSMANSLWQQTAGLLAIPTAMMVLGYRTGGTSGLISWGAIGLAIMAVLIVLVYRTGVPKALGGAVAAVLTYLVSGAAAVGVLAGLCFIFYKAGMTLPWGESRPVEVAKVEEKKEEKKEEAPKPVVEEKPKVEEAPKPIEPVAPPKPAFVWAPVIDTPPNYGPGKFTGDIRWMLEVKTPMALAKSACGSPFVSWVDQVALHVYDLRNGRRVGFIKDPSLPASQTLLSPDGTLLAVARFVPPNMRAAANTARPPLASLTPTGGGATGSGAGSNAANSPQIEIWGANDTRSSRRINLDGSRSLPAILGFGKNNQLITAANVNVNGIGKSLVQVWDTRTGQSVREFEAVAAVAQQPGSAALSAGGRYLAAIENGHLFVYDTESGTQVCDIEPPHKVGAPKAMSFSRDGSQLAGVLSEGSSPNLIVINTSDGSVALDAPLPGGARPDLSAESFQWVPQGGALMLGNDWIDTKTGKVVATLPPQSAGQSIGRVRMMISDYHALIEFLPVGTGPAQKVIYRTVMLPKKEIDPVLADRRTKSAGEEIASSSASAEPINVPTGDPKTLIKAANESLVAGRNPEALAIAQAAIDKFPKGNKPLVDEHAIAYHQAAVAAMRLNDLPKAREMMDKALAYGKTSRALIINSAKLDIAQQTFVARAARELDKLLAVSVDEETLNLLGAACARAEQDPRLAPQVKVFAANYENYNKKLEATKPKPGMRRWGMKWMPEAEFQATSRPPDIVKELTDAQARVKAAGIDLEKKRKALVDAKKQSHFDENKKNIERDASRKNQPMYVTKAEDELAAAQKESEDAKAAVDAANAKFPRPEFEANLEPLVPELTLVG